MTFDPVSPRMRMIKRFSLVGIVTAILAVLLSSYLLTRTAITGPLLTTLAGFGLDPQRSRLVTNLLLTILIALLAALFSRQRMLVALGALAFFCEHYLRDFIFTTLQPVRDPGGLLEPLDTAAFLHTIALMLALALVASAIGIALGEGLARILFDPLLALGDYIRQQRLSSPTSLPIKELSVALPRPGRQRLHLLGSLLQALVLVLALFLAVGSTNLFVYAPDVGLHLSPDAGGPQGSLLNDSYLSRALGGERRTFVIYLPPSYAHDSTRHYPVLYMLHGSPGHQENWFTGGKADQSENTLIQAGRAPELIMVMPDGNGRSGVTSEWGNSGDGKQRLEDALAQDLIPYVDQKYRTIPDAAHRGIGGLSMGGFGAANIGVHHPDLFGFVIALGGYYHADGPIWGKNNAYLRYNSPAELLPAQKNAWKTHFYIGGATKDDLYQQSVSFSGELKQLHIPSVFESERGYHSWVVWQLEFYHALEWLKTMF